MKPIALVVVVCALTDCESMRTQADCDRTQDFSSYHSFASIDEEPLIAPTQQREAVAWP